MIQLKSKEQISLIRDSGKILYEVLHQTGSHVKAGVSTWELDQMIGALIYKAKATAAFLNYNGFPCFSCISVNDEVIHGIPSKKKILKEGDIVGIDIGVNYKGYISDSAYTFKVGRIDPIEEKLLADTQAALASGINAAVVGNRVSHISQAVYEVVKNYGVVYEYCGHGVGFDVHEEPMIPNVVSSGGGNTRLKVGMVIAIEPMVNLGTAGVKLLPDNWTVVTRDGKKSAHFEHTVAITEDGPLILTAAP